MGAAAPLIGLIAGIAVAAKEGTYEDIAMVGAMIPYAGPILFTPYLIAKQGEREADFLRDQARSVEDETRIHAAELRKTNLERMELERLGFLRSGVMTSSGSPLDVLVSNSLQREQEVLDLELAGANQSRELRAARRNVIKSSRLAAGQTATKGFVDLTAAAMGAVGGGGVAGAAGGAGGGGASSLLSMMGSLDQLHQSTFGPSQ